MYMGIASSAKVAGNGAAELEFTLVEVITLKDVSHVRGILRIFCREFSYLTMNSR